MRIAYDHLTRILFDFDLQKARALEFANLEKAVIRILFSKVDNPANETSILGTMNTKWQDKAAELRSGGEPWSIWGIDERTGKRSRFEYKLLDTQYALLQNTRTLINQPGLYEFDITDELNQQLYCGKKSYGFLFRTGPQHLTGRDNKGNWKLEFDGNPTLELTFSGKPPTIAQQRQRTLKYFPSANLPPVSNPYIFCYYNWNQDFNKLLWPRLKVINTATGTLNVNITPEDATLFSVDKSSLAVNAADTLAVNVTFNFASGQAGRNETNIAFTPTDKRVWGKTLRAMAIVTQSDVWAEDFNTSVQPTGFFTEGWVFRDQVATTGESDGMAAMFGGGSSSFLMTPPLKVESAKEALLFSVKSGSSDDGMAGMGAMFGGGSSSIVVEKSVYGSNKWEKVREFTEPLDTTYRVLWVSYVEPGEYRFRILASDSIVVDSIAGFHIDNNAPDIYVLHNNTAASAINYGMPQANSTETFAVVNTGTGTLQVGVATTDEKTFALSGKDLAIEASDTATVDVTYVFDQESLGIHQGAVTFTPTTSVLVPISSGLTAYSTYADAWTEDFEPEFLREDETQPIDLPEGWQTTGWEVKLPSSGGGLMDMFSGLMGGGGDEAPKTWMATTESEAYELITPRLQAKKGDVLRFEAELGGGGMMAMLGMFMGGGSGDSGQLNVYYSIDNGANWTYYDTFTKNGYAYFVAPYSGVYQLRFTSPSASLDNFYGLRKASDEIPVIEKLALNDDKAFNNDTETVCGEITYTRNFTHTKWQALYLPFEMAYEDWSADFEVARLNDVHQWDDDDDGIIDRTELEVVKIKSGTTEANMPYLIRAKEKGEKTITMKDVTLHKADELSIDCSSVFTLFTFTGTYTGIEGSTMFTEGYYAMGDGSLVQAAGSQNNLLPYRWYLSVTDRYGNPKNVGEVKVAVFGFDEDTDGIEEIESENIAENEQTIYDLSGRRIVSPRSGMYIRNGKKYLIK